MKAAARTFSMRQQLRFREYCQVRQYDPLVARRFRRVRYSFTADSCAAKKVAGSWAPGEMQPVPTRP